MCVFKKDNYIHLLIECPFDRCTILAVECWCFSIFFELIA